MAKAMGKEPRRLSIVKVKVRKRRRFDAGLKLLLTQVAEGEKIYNVASLQVNILCVHIGDVLEPCNYTGTGGCLAGISRRAEGEGLAG